MKRFVLSCCILAATSTMVFAQASKTIAKNKNTNTAATQSKSATISSFTGKVNLFEAGILRDRMDLAKQNFEDLKAAMTQDMGSLKPKIVNAANDNEKKRLIETVTKKQDIYSAILNSASDLQGNGKKIIELLRKYQATL